MSFPAALIAQFALKSIVTRKLHGTTQLHGTDYLRIKPSKALPETTEASSVEQMSFRKIPVNRVICNTTVSYVSAIAHQLAAQQSVSPEQVAQEVMVSLREAIAETVDLRESQPVERIWRTVIFKVVSPGWLHLQVTDAGLAVWLQYLIDDLQGWDATPGSIDNLAENTETSLRAFTDSLRCARRSTDSLLDLENLMAAIAPIRTSTEFFTIQYVHARCCALLRLGSQAGLIAAQFNLSSIILTDPKPLPWMNSQQQLCCQHPADQALLSAVIDYIDRLMEARSPLQSMKRAQILSHAFMEFYAACPLLGIQASDPALAQARLGLVLITQRLLHAFLKNQMRSLAPAEL